MTPEIVVADYANPDHAQQIVQLLGAYVSDPMGGGEPLSAYVKDNLVKELAKVPRAFSLICYVDGRAVALANCLESFSTFACKSILNIHDLVVLKEFRQQGLSHLMLDEIERIAREKGHCKVTLELLERNELAKKLYLKHGFSGYELDPAMGKALFWQKEL